MKNFTLKSSILAGIIILNSVSLTKAEVSNASGNIELNSKSYGSGTIVSTVNNHDVISVAPTNGGVTHDYYNKFNVNNNGLTIKNGVGCQGSGSSIIINEVVGNSVSNINGRVDLIGDSAKFFLINPNGINVNGAGFAGNFSDVFLNTYSHAIVEDGHVRFTTDSSKLTGSVNFLTQGSVYGVTDVFAKNIYIDDATTLVAPQNTSNSIGNSIDLVANNDIVNLGTINGRNISIRSFNGSLDNLGTINAISQLKMYIAKDIMNQGSLNAINLNINTNFFHAMGGHNGGTINAQVVTVNANKVFYQGVINADLVNFNTNDITLQSSIINVSKAINFNSTRITFAGDNGNFPIFNVGDMYINGYKMLGLSGYKKP